MLVTLLNSTICVLLLLTCLPTSAHCADSRNCIIPDSIRPTDSFSMSSKKVPLDTTPIVGKRVQFEFSSSKSINLSPQSKLYYNAVVKYLKINTKSKVMIVGHTDNQGQLDELQKISDDRAIQVQMYFVRQGINKFQLLATGKADRESIASNSTAEGRAKNNRVEIVIVGSP